MIDKLYCVFQKNGINIAKDDFVYGLTNLIHWLTFIMILIPIGLTLNILIESCLFYIFYSQLRKYTGGIHMEKNILCITSSLIISVIIPIIAKKFIINSLLIVMISYTFTIMFIFFHKSIQHKNKPLSEGEITYYTRNAVIVELIYAILSICLLLLNFRSISTLILYTTIFCTMELLILSILNLN